MEPVFWLMRFGCTKMQRQKNVMKNTEKKRKPKILALLKKTAFPVSFADKDHQNRNFIMSNTIVILLLLG